MNTKQLLIATLGASISNVKADPIWSDVDYSRDLGCGRCILGGYNFCWKTLAPGEVLEDNEYPEHSDNNVETRTACCRDENDSENCGNIVTGFNSFTSDWICSSSYDSPVYGLHVCPFKKSTCGSRTKFNFYEKGEDGAVHINNL